MECSQGKCVSPGESKFTLRIYKAAGLLSSAAFLSRKQLVRLTFQLVREHFSFYILKLGKTILVGEKLHESLLGEVVLLHETPDFGVVSDLGQALEKKPLGDLSLAPAKLTDLYHPLIVDQL